MRFFKKAKKITKKEEKDPIRDKYTKKVGFFKKMVMKFNNLKDKTKANESLMDDIKAFVGIISGVAIYGILGTLFLGLFGFSFSIGTIFGVGSGLWLLENKFIDLATRILGSVKLVQINN